MEHRALIIVDMLNDFIIPFVKSELEKARVQKDLIVFLCDNHKKNDLEFRRFPEHCVTGTWGANIVGELWPDTQAWRSGGSFEYIINKQRYSGFFNTSLHILMKHLSVPGGATEVEVVGVCTSICVMDTVGGLANRDYGIVVPRLGVADFDNHAHEFSLKRMEKLYGAKIV